MDLSSKLVRAGAAGAAALVATTVSAHAWAVACNTLPAPIYGIGGSAPNQLFAKLGKALTNATPAQTIVYQSPGACLGPNAILSGTKMTGTATWWDGTGAAQSCDLPLVGQTADFGAGSTYATFCPGINNLPATFGDFLGPIEAFDFIVPQASSQTTISAAAAYLVYGLGAAGQAAPWTDETEIFKRDANSAAGIITSLGINVPIAKYKGVDAKSNGNTVTLVSAAPNPENAIGFCSGETADANLSVVKVLAFQAYNQTCGYWPSSTSTGFDKQNIRNGHYPLWSPLHFFATTDGVGNIVNPAAAQLIGYFTGKATPPTGVNVDSIAIKVGTVLDCAMEVKRTTDFGSVVPYAPAAPCGCYFDSVATGSTTCAACTASTDCGLNAPNCRKGFCEVN